jgi:hypothetical protein
MVTPRMSTAARMQLSRSAYHCVLDAQPDFLVPGGATLSRVSTADLVLSEHCWFGPGHELPFAENVSAGTDVLWVRDLETEVVLPYRLRPHTADVLRSTAPGAPLAAQLRIETVRALAAAGVLVIPKQFAKRAKHFAAEHQRRTAKFRRSNYAPLGFPIHPFHVGALRRYLRYKIRTGAVWLGDDQSKRRFVAHNEPVVRYFHHQLTRLMSATVGEPVKPSYVYFASYQDGADLKKHTDREQCEFSVTMQIDFSPEPRDKTPWPICLEVNGKTVKVRQALGEALLYKGIELPHFRSRIPKGCTSTSIFFHYVPVGFKGSLD